MSKLIRADFVRLFKSTIFQISVIVMIGFAFYTVLFNPEKLFSSADRLIVTDTFTSVVTAVLITSFVGTEYHNGTIRNKMSIGCRRIDIILSDIIVCLSAAALLYFIKIAVVLCAGSSMIGKLALSDRELFKIVTACFLITFSYAALYLLIAILNTNKAAGSVIALLLSFGMMFAAIRIDNALKRPEYIISSHYFGNGEHELVKEPNPTYIGGTQRKVYRLLYDTLPNGQILQLTESIENKTTSAPDIYEEDKEASPIYLLMLNSTLVVLVSAAAGILLFRRKNLK